MVVHGGVPATRRGGANRRAQRRPLEPNGGGRLRRVVLPLEVGLAGGPDVRLSPLEPCRGQRAWFAARPAAGGDFRAGLAVAAFLGAAGADADVCYLALLLPVLGFVNIYFMEYSLVADHWQYAAMIVPCAAFAGLVSRQWSVVSGQWSLVSRGQRTTGNRQRTTDVHPSSFILRPFIPGRLRRASALLATLAALPGGRAAMYADVETLYRTTIDRNPDCWMAHNNLGVAWRARTIDEAIGQYQKAPEIKPDYAEAHINLGTALAGCGGSTRRWPSTKEPWKSNPTMPRPTTTWAARWPAADRSTRRSASTEGPGIKPDYAEAHNNLGVALRGKDGPTRRSAQYQKALELKPDYAEAHNNWASLWPRGRIDEAIGALPAGPENQARLRPGPLQPRLGLGRRTDRRGHRALPEALALPGNRTTRPWRKSCRPGCGLSLSACFTTSTSKRRGS